MITDAERRVVVEAISALVTEAQLATPAFLVDRRWDHWRPLAALISSQCHIADPAEAFAHLRVRHRSRVTDILNSGIAWVVLCRQGLDNPMVPDAQFESSLRLAIERRRSRLGRVKGKGKKYKCAR